MKDLVLELAASYENRISTIQELIASSYEMASAFEQEGDALDKERAKLRTSLQNILARNCSLRRKDFNGIIERVISDCEMRRQEIEEERWQVGQELKQYLDEQKALAVSLQQKLSAGTEAQQGMCGIETIVEGIKAAYQGKVERLFGLLHSFRLRLEGFQQEQKEINEKLQRLVERGELLKLEDLRQLESARKRDERKAERETLREEVSILLRQFRYERQGYSRHRWEEIKEGGQTWESEQA